MALEIRKIEKKDNGQIAELIRNVFIEFGIDRPGTVFYDPTTDNLYDLFLTPGSEYWIAEVDSIIVGGCGIFPTPGLPEGCVELVKFYLDRPSRGKGTGWKLLERSFMSAKAMGYTQVYLESLPELNKAISLYERAGFRFTSSSLGNSGHFGCTIWMIRDL